MNVVQSLEAQEAKDLSEVLARRTFTDGSNMLNDLHFTKKIIKVPVNMVMLTPTPSQSVSLEEVNIEINKIDGNYTPPLNDLNSPRMKYQPQLLHQKVHQRLKDF